MILNNNKNDNNQHPENNRSDGTICSNPSRKRTLLPDITTSINNNNNHLPLINKKQKIYLQYNPLENKEMTKDEIKQWRLQQRKLRNRQSAAASRQKVRNQIENLEKQVQVLQHKYDIVLDRLKHYEPSFDENNMYSEQQKPHNVVSYSSPSQSPSVVSCNSIDTSTTANINAVTCPNSALNDNIEPQLVEEGQQQMDSIGNDITLYGPTDDEELEEFLSYAFSETE